MRLIPTPESIEQLSKVIEPRSRKRRTSPVERAREMLAVDPDNGFAYLMLATEALQAGSGPEGVEAGWKAVERNPVGPRAYLIMADILFSQEQPDFAMRFVRLGMSKIGLQDKVEPEFSSRFAKLLSRRKEARNPDTYLAYADDPDEWEFPPLPPEVEHRLMPLEWLNDIHLIEYRGSLSDSALQGLLGRGEETAVLLKYGLREATYVMGPDGEMTAPLRYMVALLGETGGPETAGQLLELGAYFDYITFLYVNWAVYRLGQRFPEAVLPHLSFIGPQLPPAMRCAIAEQMCLLPESLSAVTDALVALLGDFPKIAKEEGAAELVRIVVDGMIQREEHDRARDLLDSAMPLLRKADAKRLRGAFEGDDEIQLHLVSAKIPGLDIEDILTGALEDPGDFDDDDEFDDDEELADNEIFDDPFLVAAKPPKPGRNKPCWCGSGKAYKKCHLDSDNSGGTIQAKRPDKAVDREIRGRLSKAILEGADRWHTKEESLQALEQYFGAKEPPLENPQEMNWFLQWMCQDFRGHTGRTLIEHFAARQGHGLPLRDREILRGWLASYPAICEVERVEPEVGVHVRNVLTDERHFVHDVMGSRSFKRADWTLCRLEVLDGETGFASDCMSVPPAVRQRLIEHIAQEASDDGITPVEYVRRMGNLLCRTIHELSEGWLHGLTIVNREGDLVEESCAEYLILDEAKLTAQLRSLPQLEEMPPQDGELAFLWSEHVAGTGQALFGTLRVAGDRLRLFTESQTRLQLGRGLLEANAGPYLRHLEDRVVSQAEMKENIRRRPASERGDHPPPSPEEQEILRAVKEEHYRTWPDHPLPALGGRTPRQAMKSKTGRQSLIRLIRDMEADELARGHDPVYDFNILRDNLGLERE